MFNEDLCMLYEDVKGTNNISPDPIEIQNIEIGVKFQQIIYYGRNKSEYDLIYQNTLDFDRTKMPSICVRTK